jgi:hypothetical protein
MGEDQSVRFRNAPAGLLVLVLLVVAMAGCGDGDDSTTVPTKAAPVDRALPDGTAAGPAGAKGRRACQGLTPLQAAQRYRKAARRAGATKLFIASVAEPDPATETSPGYPRLVAALFATTVPPRDQTEAAAGCAEELAASIKGGGTASARKR